VDARDADGATPLMRAARGPTPAGVMGMLLDLGADPDARDREGRTALHHAVEARSMAALRPLLWCGANQNLASRAGDTPLILACALGELHMTTMLLLWHPLPSTLVYYNRAGVSPLHAACAGGHAVLAMVLLGVLEMQLPGAVP
jgi:cytohesin